MNFFACVLVILVTLYIGFMGYAIETSYKDTHQYKNIVNTTLIAQNFTHGEVQLIDGSVSMCPAKAASFTAADANGKYASGIVCINKNNNTGQVLVTQ